MTIPVDMYNFYDVALANIETYLHCIFNVDYRTLDKWKEKLLSSFSNFSQVDIIDKYIDVVKKNHIVVESEHISIDPGTIYESEGRLYIRSYVKYRITADNIDTDHYELLYGKNNNLIGLKNGEWRYGYYDISYNPGNPVYIHAFNSIDDSIFMEMTSPLNFLQ